MQKKIWISVAVGVAIVAIAVAVFVSQRRSQGEIRFGATLPLTGEAASYGQNAKRGIELAVSEINSRGGLLGRQVAVDFQDDRNDKKEGVSIFTKFATIDKVPVVFGSAGSGVTLAIVPLANRYKVMLISPVASSSKLSVEGGPYFARTVPADDLQADVLSKWVHDSGAKRVAIIYTNNAWGKPLADGFQSKFEALGGQVLLSEGVAENTNDFRTIIAKVAGLGELDAIVSPTYPKEGGVLVRQAKELGLKATLFGGDNWGAPEFRNIAASAAEGVFYTAPSESKSSAHSDFAARYKAKFGEEPDVFAAYAFDAATAIFKAIETCGNAEAANIRDALHQVSFGGVSGNIAFRENGDLQVQGFERKTISDGKPITVK